jgi:hypothetical protein
MAAKAGKIDSWHSLKAKERAEPVLTSDKLALQVPGDTNYITAFT